MLYENTFLLVTGKCFLHSPESLFVVSYDLLRPRLFQSWDKPHVGPASWALLRQLHDRASITPPPHDVLHAHCPGMWNSCQTEPGVGSLRRGDRQALSKDAEGPAVSCLGDVCLQVPPILIPS